MAVPMSGPGDLTNGPKVSPNGRYKQTPAPIPSLAPGVKGTFTPPRAVMYPTGDAAPTYVPNQNTQE